MSAPDSFIRHRHTKKWVHIITRGFQGGMVAPHNNIYRYLLSLFQHQQPAVALPNREMWNAKRWGDDFSCEKKKELKVGRWRKEAEKNKKQQTIARQSRHRYQPVLHLGQRAVSTSFALFHSFISPLFLGFLFSFLCGHFFLAVLCPRQKVHSALVSWMECHFIPLCVLFLRRAVT